MSIFRMNSQGMVQLAGIIIAGICMGIACPGATADNSVRKPNIIFLLADDLGYGDIGCFGQKQIPTPNIDRLAKEGITFTDFYAGSTVCAPSRCSLMTGLHTGHAPIRGNLRDENIGVATLSNEYSTIAEAIKDGSDYVTAMCGRWHLGGEKSKQQPSMRGFDYSFGKLSSLYSTHSSAFIDPLFGYRGKHIPFEQYSRIRYEPMYENGKLYDLEKRFAKERPIEMDELNTKKAIEFIIANKEKPFFLYMPFAMVHAPMEMHPSDQFKNKDWPHAEKAFATMLVFLDDLVGKVMKALEEEGLDGETCVFFTGDNGPHQEDGHKYDFFDSNGPLRGGKRDLYEGGIRMPTVARWPGKINAGTTTNHISAFWDLKATFCDIAGAHAPDNTDGISFLPTLLGQDQKEKHRYLYWEFHEDLKSKQAIRMGPWKGIRLSPSGPVELYDLSIDIGEKNDVAKQHPKRVKKIKELFEKARTDHPDFPLKE